MIATILAFLKTVPSWAWIALVSIGIVYGSYRMGRSAQATEDQVRYDQMIANADTVWVPRPVELPRPNKPQMIPGTVIKLPESVAKELQELREAKISNEQKIAKYDSLLIWTALPFESTYEDAVQKLHIFSYPSTKEIFPSIDYKPQTALVPQITQTIVPPSLPFYKTGTAKVIYGVVGAGLIYGAIESNGKTRTYLSMAGVTVLTIGIAL